MQLDYQSSTSISHFSVILLIFLHLLSYSNVVFVPVFLAFVLYVVDQFCVCIKFNRYLNPHLPVGPLIHILAIASNP